MTKEKVVSIIAQFKDLLPEDKLQLFKSKLEKADDEAYERLMMVKTYNVTTVTLFSIFLGGVSGDRFYLGDIDVAIAKLLFGSFTFGIWNLVDIFCCRKRAREKNFNNFVSVL